MGCSITATFSDSSPDEVLIQMFEDDGRGVQKRVRIKDFIKSIMDSEVSAPLERCHVNAIPYLYDMAVSNGGFKVVQVVPKSKALVQYKGLKFLVPFPALAFSTTVTDGKIVDSRVFAVADKEINDATKLYHYPFGNVYSHGEICWGGTGILKRTDYRSPKDLAGIPMEFLSAATNDDLWLKEYCTIPEVPALLSSIYEELQSKEEFPDEVLSPMGTKTLRDLF